MSKEELLFVPLGGAGEFGMNLNLYGFGPAGGHRWMMVDLGIAFGAPTALAADAADVVIPGDRLERIFTAFELIGTTRRRVRQNLGWALLYNAVAIPLAVSGHLNPLFAAVAMSASSLLVVWNSARPIASLGLASPAAGLDQDRAKVLMRLGSPK